MSWHCFSATGDAEPHASPRTQMKLTKPRTRNNSTSNLLGLATQGSAPTSAPAPPQKDGPDHLVVLGSEAPLATSASDRRSRQSSYHTLKSIPQGFQAEDQLATASCHEKEQDQTGGSPGNSNGLGGLVTGMKKRLSRPASQKSLPALPSASASSTLLSSYPSKFSLIAEDTSPGSNTPARAVMELEDTSNESTPQSNRDSLPPSLTRRRTMLVPGIATRGQPKDVLRKPPPPDSIETEADRDYYYNPSYPQSSPLALLASLNLSPEGRPSLSEPRAMTPSDLDYSHLGGFKRGSLHITNGAASPAPSSIGPNDYFPAQSVLNPTQRTCAPLGNHGSEGVFAKHTPTSSLLQSELRLVPIYTAALDRLGHAETRVPDDASTMFDHESEIGVPITPTSLGDEVLPVSQLTSKTPDRASNIAQEYMNELPDSPFSFQASRVASPRPDAASQKVLVGSDFFQDEGVVTSPSTSGGHFRVTDTCTPDRRDDPCHFDSSPSQLAVDVNAFEPRSSSVESDKSVSDRRTLRSKALSKSDSGYSSHVSLRSLERAQPVELRDAVFETVGIDRSYRSTEQQAVGLHVEAPTRAAPLPPPPAPSTAEEEGERPAVPPKSAYQAHRKSMPTIRFSDVPAGRDITPPISPQQRKLQKSRRQSQPRLTPPAEILVQAFREIDEKQIPPVPLEVAARLVDRLRRFPTLDHTYLSLDHTATTEDVSVRAESLEMRGHASRPPQISKRASVDSSPTLRRGHSAVTQLNAERRNSAMILYEDNTDILADFGTVTESLGASPYDVAMHAAGVDMKARRHSTQSTTGWYPHQIGAISHAHHSTIGMSGASAAALAREKSKDYSASNRRSFVRPRSFAEDFTTPPRRQPTRPKSIVVGRTLPVPSLPQIREQRSQLSFIAPTSDEPPASESVSPPPPTRQAPSAPVTPQPSQWSSQAAAAWSARRQSANATLLHRPQSTLTSPSSLSFNSPSGTPTPTGRYSGGLSYSYEPGCGLGGSAGTREMLGASGQEDRASRKGMQISRKWGVDLSDVPIFVVKG